MSDAALLAFDTGAAWREMAFVSVDVETTGLDAETCRVIEVGIVRFERGQPAERWGMLLDPGTPIPDKVVEITGIADAMVAGKPSFRDVKWQIRSRIQDRLFVAYNSDFDHRVLEREFERCGLTMPIVPVLDPLVWARRLMPSADSHSLGNVCARLGVDLEDAHRAEHDAEATGKLTLRMADKLAPTLGMLLSDQAEWKAQQDEERAARKAAKALLRGDDLDPPPDAAPVEEPDRNQVGLF
jgi:DNA polymerase III epsilon subunit family exonuclease